MSDSPRSRARQLTKFAHLMSIVAIAVLGLLTVIAGLFSQWTLCFVSVGAAFIAIAMMSYLSDRRQLHSFRVAIRQGLSGTKFKAAPTRPQQEARVDAEVIAILARNERLLNRLLEHQGSIDSAPHTEDSVPQGLQDRLTALEELCNETRAQIKHEVLESMNDIRADLLSLSSTIAPPDSPGSEKN